MRILIVEDDGRIAAFVSKGLTAEGFSVTVTGSADEAEEALRGAGDDIDLMLLDLGLPGRSGTELLHKLRRNGSLLPVIVLTARAEVSDRVRGLDAGANDYVTKPFAFEELLARIRAVGRAAGQPTSTELTVGDLRLDLLSKVAWRGGRRIDLAPREWALLELFMRQPTRVLSRAHILSRVWQYDLDPGTNVVDVYVGYLRRKLNVNGAESLIHTVRGAGYRLISP
jgi:two-component system, OmpR family, response regulator